MRVYRVEIYKGAERHMAWDIWYFKAKTFNHAYEITKEKLTKTNLREHTLRIGNMSEVCVLDN